MLLPARAAQGQAGTAPTPTVARTMLLRGARGDADINFSERKSCLSVTGRKARGPSVKHPGSTPNPAAAQGTPPVPAHLDRGIWGHAWIALEGRNISQQVKHNVLLLLLQSPSVPEPPVLGNKTTSQGMGERESLSFALGFHSGNKFIQPKRI